MRLLELRLLKFGLFENQTLQFGDGAGLHIIYGLNEAGKSTALRAIRSFFYGIPERTTDNFNFDYDALRIGAVLSLSDGTVQAFVRRKGKKSLLSESGAPVDLAALQKYLMGVDEDTFAVVFGIDHAALERGSKLLLREHGEVGVSLFSARMGGNVRAILAELTEKAAGLYKERAQSPLLNKALKDYEERRLQARKLSVPSKQYLDCRQDLEDLEENRRKLDEELRTLGTQRARLERLLKALPYLEQRKELLKRRQDMGEVLVLREGFAAERMRTEESLSENEARKDALIEKQRRLKERIDGLHIPAELLAQERAIKELYQRLGVCQQGNRDLPGLRAQAEAACAAAEAILKELRPGMGLPQADSMRLEVAKRTRIQTLGNSCQALHTTCDTLKNDAAELAAELQRARDDLAACQPPPDTGALESALRRAQNAGDLEGELAKAVRKCAASQQQLEREFQRVRFWQGPLDALVGLRVPAPETLARFERRFNEIEKKHNKLEPQLQGNQTRAEELQRKLADLRRGGTIPSEEELLAARARRERGWKLVRGAWLERQENAAQFFEFDPELKLPEAYEKSVRQADEVSDGLRRDAARVAQQQNTLDDLKQCAEERTKLETGREKLAAERTECQAEWEALWQALGVQPGEPSEIKAWLECQKGLVRRADERREQQERASELEEAIRGHSSALTEALRSLSQTADTGAAPATLSALVDKASKALSSINERIVRRAALENKVKDLEGKLARKERERDAAEEKLRRWQADWSEAAGWLGLPATATPAEANAFLERLAGLFRNLEEAGDKSRRVSQIIESNEHFAADVAALTARIAPDLAGAPAEQAAPTLNTHLEKAREDNATRMMALEEWEGGEKDLENVQEQLAALLRKQENLYAEAHCTDTTKIEELGKRSAAYVACLREIKQKEDVLSQNGTVEELSTEAEGVNRDALPADIEARSREMREKEAYRQTLSDEIAKSKHYLGLMDGGAKAAEAAQEAQLLLGQIRTEAENCLRLRLGALLLRREIERYRRENEGPLVTRTSKLLSQLTRGAFSGVRTDAGEDGQTVLVAVRNATQASAPAVELPVEKLSSGTRDQLYLALHLAQLQDYLERTGNEPVPFIVDDVLINFDDERGAAALGVLFEIARQTQVLVFTHHQRVAELARKELAALSLTTRGDGAGLCTYSFAHHQPSA